MIAGKVWGDTKLIEANSALEFHKITMLQGGVCSKHLHRYKWNGFFVSSGRMLIRIWQEDYNLIDETVLGPGDYTKVQPGLYHQFECLKDGIAYELYWAEFNHNDIVRENHGSNKMLTDSSGESLYFPYNDLLDSTTGTFAEGSTAYDSITINMGDYKWPKK